MKKKNLSKLVLAAGTVILFCNLASQTEAQTKAGWVIDQSTVTWNLQTNVNEIPPCEDVNRPLDPKGLKLINCLSGLKKKAEANGNFGDAKIIFELSPLTLTDDNVKFTGNGSLKINTSANIATTTIPPFNLSARAGPGPDSLGNPQPYGACGQLKLVFYVPPIGTAKGNYPAGTTTNFKWKLVLNINPNPPNLETDQCTTYGFTGIAIYQPGDDKPSVNCSVNMWGDVAGVDGYHLPNVTVTHNGRELKVQGTISQAQTGYYTVYVSIHGRAGVAQTGFGLGGTEGENYKADFSFQGYSSNPPNP